MNPIKISEDGYYGSFGGAFIPEMLYPNVQELKENYLQIIQSPESSKEFEQLLTRLCGQTQSFVLGRAII
jgi:tryptophan synthase beta chain